MALRERYTNALNTNSVNHPTSGSPVSLPGVICSALRILAAVPLVMVAPLARPVPASALSISSFGTNIHATWSVYSDADRTKMLDLSEGIGGAWVRIDVGWSSLEDKGKGTAAMNGAGGSKWYLDRLDSVVAQANARGLRVLATVTDSPAWARPANCSPGDPGGTSVRCAPANPKDYADFMAFFATHYAGKIAAVEIWNEPNQSSYMIPSNPSVYAGLVKAAYPVIKKAAPAMTVVAGSVSANDNTFIQGMYANGVKNNFDALSTHPYMSASDLAPDIKSASYNPYIMTSIPYVRATMVANGDSAKPIWFTEFGWSTHANTGSEQPWDRGVTLTAQADYAVRCLSYIKQNYPYVATSMWYVLVDRSDATPQTNNWGLYTTNYTAKPAVAALQNYFKQVAAATPAPQPAPGSGNVPSATGKPDSAATPKNPAAGAAGQGGAAKNGSAAQDTDSAGGNASQRIGLRTIAAAIKRQPLRILVVIVSSLPLLFLVFYVVVRRFGKRGS